jgi:hypothetical protein
VGAVLCCKFVRRFAGRGSKAHDGYGVAVAVAIVVAPHDPSLHDQAPSCEATLEPELPEQSDAETRGEQAEKTRESDRNEVCHQGTPVARLPSSARGHDVGRLSAHDTGLCHIRPRLGERPVQIDAATRVLDDYGFKAQFSRVEC